MSDSVIPFITIIRQRSASYMHGTYMNNQGLFKALKKKDIIFSILGLSVLNPVYEQVPQTMLFYKSKKVGGGRQIQNLIFTGRHHSFHLPNTL